MIVKSPRNVLETKTNCTKQKYYTIVFARNLYPNIEIILKR